MVLLPCRTCCKICWNCLALSDSTFGRIIFEAEIGSISSNPDIDQTFECGLWPGLRLNFDGQSGSMIGSHYGTRTGCFQCESANPSFLDAPWIRIPFTPTNESNSDLPDYQPVVVFLPGGSDEVGLVKKKVGATYCAVLKLQAGWEDWEAVGFGDYTFGIDIVHEGGTIGSMSINLRLTDRLAVEDLSNYPHNYFDTDGLSAGQNAGCVEDVLDKDEYKIIGGCKPDGITCNDFCKPGPPKRQWFRTADCEPVLPCNIDGKRVVPGPVAEIDCSNLSVVDWGGNGGSPGEIFEKPEGFTGTLEQMTTWLSSLKPTAYRENYPLKPPSIEDDYPTLAAYELRGCKEFWTGGPPPFEGVGKDFCDRTGGNDLAGIYNMAPPGPDFEICGLKQGLPGEPQRPSENPQNSFFSSSLSCEISGIPNGFGFAEPYSDNGYCSINLTAPTPSGVTVVQNGMKRELTIPAIDYQPVTSMTNLRAVVWACRFYTVEDWFGNKQDVIEHIGVPVVLEGDVKITYSFEGFEEPIGTCCLPTGQCVETDKMSCLGSCGGWDENRTLEECKGLPCELDPYYFSCWDFDMGLPPPNYVPVGTIGESCEDFTKETPMKNLVPATTKTTTGPGTELAALLKTIGIDSKEKGCQCKSHAKRMDKEGPQWCRDNIDTILGWLQTEAKKRKLPFIKTAAKQVVLLAIRRAEKKS